MCAHTSGKSNLIVSFSVCLCVRTIPKMLIDKFTRMIYITNVVANSIKAIHRRVGGNDATMKERKNCARFFFGIYDFIFFTVLSTLLTFGILHFCHSIGGAIDHLYSLVHSNRLIKYYGFFPLFLITWKENFTTTDSFDLNDQIVQFPFKQQQLKIQCNPINLC